MNAERHISVDRDNPGFWLFGRLLIASGAALTLAVFNYILL
jgi:hypothetical protein